MLSVLSVALQIAANVAISVSVVLVNKYVFEHLHFRWAISLTAYHFAATGLFTTLCGALGLFVRVSIPARSVLLTSIGFSASIVLMNMSLKSNSVGFFQLSKLTVVPVTVMLQYGLHRKAVSARTIFVRALRRGCCISRPLSCRCASQQTNALVQALATLTVGVLLATVNDVAFNLIGAVYAGAAVLCTAAFQLVSQRMMTALEVNSLQARRPPALV